MSIAPARMSLNELVPPETSDISFLASREALRWKTWFYKGLLPVLARRGAVRAGQDLERAGTLMDQCWRPRRKRLLKIVPREVLQADPGRTPEDVIRGISSQMLRYMARDCLFERTKPDEWNEVFEVEGFEFVEEVASGGQGAIFLGSHLGGHLAALHWMIAHGVQLRMLVQRPKNVSAGLDAWFDQDHPICDQRNLFLRRDLNPSEAARRTLEVRRLIRSGISVYTNCDICWSGPNTDSCRFLGQDVRFQSIWIDLAMVLGCPVIGIECRQLAGGRFRLSFRKPESIGPRDARQDVFERTIFRLERSILEYPDDAIAHLTWSLFRPRRRIKSDSEHAGASPTGPATHRRPRSASRSS